MQAQKQKTSAVFAQMHVGDGPLVQLDEELEEVVDDGEDEDGDDDDEAENDDEGSDDAMSEDD